MVKLLLFLLLVNFDVMVAALALGAALIRVKFAASVLVAAVSAAFFGVALVLGGSLAVIFPVDIMHDLGLVLLALLTLLWLKKFCGQERGGLAGIWRRPHRLDVNADKFLSLPEALLLAVAVGLDSTSGGLAFGLLGHQNPLWMLLCAAVAWLMFVGGNRLGREICRALLAEADAEKNKHRKNSRKNIS